MKKFIIILLSTLLFSILFIVLKDQYENKLLAHAEFGLPLLFKKEKLKIYLLVLRCFVKDWILKY